MIGEYVLRLDYDYPLPKCGADLGVIKRNLEATKVLCAHDIETDINTILRGDDLPWGPFPFIRKRILSIRLQHYLVFKIISDRAEHTVYLGIDYIEEDAASQGFIVVDEAMLTNELKVDWKMND